jgi:DNA-binding transcriptional ArsR family regulator
MNLRRDVFQAIADPTRRAILLLLASQAMTAGAIAANFDSARPTVSKHLQILTACELLKQMQNGREIFYSVNPEKVKEVAEWAEQFRQLWDERFNKLETIMKKYQ